MYGYIDATEQACVKYLIAGVGVLSLAQGHWAPPPQESISLARGWWCPPRAPLECSIDVCIGDPSCRRVCRWAACRGCAIAFVLEPLAVRPDVKASCQTPRRRCVRRG